jgi:type II secretory pathway component PulL
MQSINIYLTKTEIGYYLPDSTENWNSVNLEIGQSEPNYELLAFEGFKKLLGRIDHPESYKINIIPDQHYILYSYLKLPIVSKRKIPNILQHELGSHLINDISEYHYDYMIKINKEQSFIECGVYFIEKDLVKNLFAIAKTFSVEIAGIYPLNYFISQNYLNGYQVKNDSRIFIHLNDGSTKLFVYHQGFLAGYATIFNEHSDLDDLIKIINQKITAIVLYENQVDFIQVDTSHPDIIVENEESEIVYSTNPPLTSDHLPKTDYRPFNQFFKQGTPPKFNFLKTNLLIFKELKKYSKKLIFSASLFFLCSVIYLMNVGFDIYSNNQINQQLDSKYTKMINTYLPKGTSKINAIYILKQRITDFENQQEMVKKYAEKKYETIKFINDVSLFKSNITSLIVNRLSYGQNSISIQGQVDTISDYDLLQEIIIEKYPEDLYRLKMDQKSQGNDSIFFTATIRPL